MSKELKEVIKSFIEECKEEDIEFWAKLRGFDLALLTKLKIGCCTVYSMDRLKQKYPIEVIRDAGLVDANAKFKYNGRIIIPYNEHYFSARQVTQGDPKFKNMFPKGLKKQIFCIDGNANGDLYISEGETDAIRLKMVFPDSTIISIGGCKSSNLLVEIIKKIKLQKPKRVIYAFDNDDAGKLATEDFLKLMQSTRELYLFKDIVYKLKFDKSVKDIDEYFNKSGKVENLLYEKVEFQFKVNKDSIYSMNLPIDSFYDNAKRYYELQPYFYDASGIFWMWNEKLSKYEYSDEVDLMRKFDKCLGYNGECVNSSIKSQTLEALRWWGREKAPKPSEKKWVQFKDKAYSIYSNKVHKITKDYFFTNPIPWELGSSDETPIMDKLFIEWVGEENKQMLYEIIAYCCYMDYPIHRIFCLIGSGSNGKSRFLALLGKFLGKENCCSTELDTLIDNRFESFKLYKKLVTLMGETNFGVLTKTSLLKKLCGQDLIGYEMKGKQPFDDLNYAKIIISSNSLPINEDTTDGFYRRWIIIDFPNQFPEGKDILETIPSIEYNNLALKSVKILCNMLRKGEFTNQGDIQNRKAKYVISSNPIAIFVATCCEKSLENFENYSKLATFYNIFLGKMKKRKVKNKEFRRALEDEGFWVEKSAHKIVDEWVSGYWIEGIKLKDEFLDNLDNLDKILSWENLGKESLSGKRVQNVQNVQKSKPPKTEEIFIDEPLNPTNLVLESLKLLSKKHKEVQYIDLNIGFDFDISPHLDKLRADNQIAEIRSGVFVLL